MAAAAEPLNAQYETDLKRTEAAPEPQHAQAGMDGAFAGVLELPPPGGRPVSSPVL